MIDNLSVSLTVTAARAQSAARNAAADNGVSFKDVFQSLSKTLEKSRQSAAAPEKAETPRPAESAVRPENPRPAGETPARVERAETEPAEAPEAQEPAEDAADAGETAEAAAENGEVFALPPLTPLQQEIVERVTVLAADNGLDPQMLAALDAEGVDALADWVAAGAGGLFPDLTGENAEISALPDSFISNSLAETPAPAPFGLGEQSAALEQLGSLLERVNAAPVRETALLGDLINLEEMSPVDVDRLAQAVLQAAGGGEDAARADLRELLAAAPEDALRAALEGALQKTEGAAELPEMPEVVLKSLAVEIVNLNNAGLDAADKQLALLNGLDNNARLRAELLAQMRTADGADLSSAVNGEKLSENLQNSPIFADLLENGTEIESIEGKAGKNPAAAAETAEFAGLPETPAEEIPPAPAAPKPARAAEKAPETPAAEETATADDAPETAELPDAGGAEEPAETERLPEKPAAKPARAENLETAAAEKPEAAEFDEAAPARGENATFGSAARENPLNFDYGRAETAEAPRQAVLQDNINRLAELVEQAAKNDSRSLKSLTLALNPHELGEVKIELQMTKNGGVAATVKVENDGAKNLLAAGFEQLRKSLETQGVSLEQFNVELEGKDAGAQSQQQQSQSQAGGNGWFGAQADERERRARAAANRIDGPRAVAETAVEPEAAPAVRHIEGSSFELIA